GIVMDYIKEKLKSYLSSVPPARVIVISFAAVIIIGALLLSMPICSREGTMTPIIDAFFTAVSATCVTGLVVYDTYTHFNVLGQLVILILIQIGGLGLVTLTTFFNIVIGKKLGLRSMKLASESINITTVNGINKMVRMAVFVTFSIEAVGALMLGLVFIPKYGLLKGGFTAIFLAISAFCNAGFDILGHEGLFVSLTNYTDSFVVMATISSLIIVGGLGFIVWQDIINYRHTKRLLLHTKVVLIVTAILIGAGTFIYFVYEWNNPYTMGGLSDVEKLGACLFQSITARTAGFNSIDIVATRDITKIFTILLMFIGAAPGSTGGGIKVTTFAVIIMTVISVITGKSDTEVLKRKVDYGIVYRSIAIATLAITAVFVCVNIIASTIPENVGGIPILFEAVSAFATVGLSSGVTGVVGIIGKLVLAFLMFVGRVGPVSLAISLAISQSKTKNKIIPEGKIMVG
ncbi:MAG: potassium transporter TrkG, partial [Oscillospiraceae bacterium]